MKRTFYTDGSCYHNGKPNAFGSAAWIEVDGDEVIGSGSTAFSPATPTPTNIRMELTAVIMALHQCGPEDDVTIYSDSAYVVNGMNQGWYNSWSKTGKTSTGKVPANLDLWRKLVRAYERIGSVTFNHIKGHNGNKFNELVDQVASQKVNELMEQLKGEEYGPAGSDRRETESGIEVSGGADTGVDSIGVCSPGPDRLDEQHSGQETDPPF